MATYTPILALSGNNPSTFEQGHLVGTDGSNLFFWDNTAGLYKYDPSTNTETFVVDQEDLVAGYGNWCQVCTKIASFKQGIYIGQLIDNSADVSDRGGRIWKYTPATDTLTAVFQRNTLANNNAWLYADDDHLFFHIAGRPSGPSVNHEGWYSTNGSSWSQASYSSDPTRLFNTFTVYSDMRANGIHFLSSNRLYKSNSNGTVTVLQDPFTIGGPSFSDFGVGQSDFYSDVGEMVFATQPKYVTVQWTTDATAAAQGAVLKDLNMPETLLQNSLTQIYQWNGANDFASLDTVATGVQISGTNGAWVWRANSGKVYILGQRTTNDWWIWQRDEDLTSTPGGWGAPGATEAPDSNRPCDINADGTFLYIGAIDLATTAPVLLKQETGLTQNATRAYDPADGTDIGVMCGRFDADVVWAAGNFGGTDIVVKTEDAGDTFEVKNPATFSSVTGFVVGPDSDDRVLLVDKNATIQETEDSGETWAEINAATGAPTTRAIGRLDINVEESVFGSDAGNIAYSPNSGENLEDISSGFADTAIYTGKNVTSIVVN